MREEERQRIERLLEHGKEEMNGETREAALRDLTRVAAEYFELSSPPVLEIKREKKGFSVHFNLTASRVKNFTSVGQGSENR